MDPILSIVALLVLGLGIGGYNERRHLKSLTKRETALAHIRTNNLKLVVDPQSVRGARLVQGHVVIATDYFKSFATNLRNLLGGEMGAARTLMLRGRREAILRMLQEAQSLGAQEVWNVRLGFCSISQMRGKRGAIQVEVLAYGTAVVRDPPSPTTSQPTT